MTFLTEYLPVKTWSYNAISPGTWSGQLTTLYILLIYVN